MKVNFLLGRAAFFWGGGCAKPFREIFKPAPLAGQPRVPKAEAKGASQKKEGNPQQYKCSYIEVATPDEGQQRNRNQKPAEQEVEQGMGKEETVVGQKVVEQVMKKEEALMSDSYKYLKKDKDGTVECPT